MWWARLLNTVAGYLGGAAVVATPPISGYAAWMDATQPSKFTYSSSNIISQWTDASGNAYNATQSTVANQPTLAASAINGKPAVRFDGVNDVFSWNLGTLTNHTIFIVLRFPSAITTSTSGQFIITNNATGHYNGIIAFGAVSGSYSNERISWVTDYNPSGVYYAGADLTAASHQLNFKFDTSGYAAGIRYDKSALSLSNAGGGFTSIDYPRFYTYLGDYGVGGGAPFVGDIGEILLYTSALSAGDITSTENYLATKWGL
jgi:hypothetical protein